MYEAHDAPIYCDIKSILQSYGRSTYLKAEKLTIVNRDDKITIFAREARVVMVAVVEVLVFSNASPGSLNLVS